MPHLQLKITEYMYIIFIIPVRSQFPSQFFIVIFHYKPFDG